MKGLDNALKLRRVLDDEGELIGTPQHPISQVRALALYRHMRRVRRLDQRMQALQRQGRIGFFGSCTGQEAAPVAAALLLSPEDWVFPGLRESALLVVRGLSLELYLAQLFGNSLDTSKGRQMPSHHASRVQNHVSWSSCIATQLPHAVGAALAAYRRGERVVILAFLGDGATSHPDFHAALNFAGVFRAGVVFVCQNNQYAISVPAARQTASATFAIKALAYGVRPDRVDGNDAFAVHDAIENACERVRSGAGPSLVECVTYRIGAHSSSDDASLYRTEQEVDAWRARDPILRLGRYLSRARLQLDVLDSKIDGDMDAEIDRALGAVEALPPPAIESLFDDVYAELPQHLIEQRASLLREP